MIQLFPKRTYKITYTKGQSYEHGDTVLFQTLENVPEAKHLIKVRDLATGEIIDLIELLIHPWDRIAEDFSVGAEPPKKKSGDLLSAIIPFFVMMICERMPAVIGAKFA